MTNHQINVDVQEIANIPHKMSFGGELFTLSDGTLFVLGKNSWCTFDGAFVVEPKTGGVREIDVPIEGSFQAISIGNDTFLLLDRKTGEMCMWNILCSSFDVIDSKSGPGQWVAHDSCDGILYILANLDLSGSDGGFDYEQHVSCMGMFDLKSRLFLGEFKPVKGHDTRGMVVQNNKRLIAVGYGRRYPFAIHASMEFEEIDSISFQHDDGLRFIGRDSQNALLALCSDDTTYALTYIHGQSRKGKVLWTYSARGRNYLLFSAAIRMGRDKQLLFFLGKKEVHRVLLYTAGVGVEFMGLLSNIPISCGVQGLDGDVYVAGGGVVTRLNFRN